MNYKRTIMDKKKVIFEIVTLIIFILLCLINLAPFVWGLITSLKTEREVLVYPPKFFNFTPSIEHYVTIFKNNYFRSVLVTLGYSTCAIIIGVLFGLMAAYAMKRYEFYGKKVLFLMILCGIPLSIGSAAMVLPNYIYFSSIGLVDRWYTLIILNMAYHMPMCTWIIMNGIDSVPIEVEESMSIDGAGKVYIIFGMIPRLCLPAFASAALFIFIGTWNEYVSASVIVNTNKYRPIQVSIYNYLGFYGRQWGPLTAAATAAVVPTLIVFSILGKYLISGLTQGAVKG